MKEAFPVKLQAENLCKNKAALINDWKNICILEKIQANQGVGEQVWFVPNTVGGVWWSPNPRNILQFLHSFKIGNSIFSI